ncbi:hypothetical protein Poli38472_009727 [Pythium oligandrum]|uniref:Uncharacterized protein n=1 Tax=Pythium oligandrum TaxID=41045 RepID=A0A8K1FIM4_PYTOL|nr:hypothetical protein Poli38472_009727 [Pythium oligandrum]|eukprot:TMW62234.1 hypothetical protein Poli38472_009727 [Pythium oligandrum]
MTAASSPQRVPPSSPPPSASPVSRRNPMSPSSQHQILQIRRMNLQSNQRKSRHEPVRNPMIMIGMVFFGLLASLLIMAFFAMAPFLCGSWLALMYMVGLYLTTESDWWWHDAQEFENRFWTMTAFLFSTAVLYIHDSPLAIGRWNSSIGMFLVVSFTSGVHFLDRFIHRQEISRKPRLNPGIQQPELFKHKETAEEKANIVTECVARIDRMYLPSTINNMINLGQVKLQEQEIFRVLSDASKDELNYIINNIRLALLFYKVKDHSKLRSDQSRTLILDLLCSGRLADLTVTSRAILLDALMVMKISAHPQCEKWVRNIILKTSGDDLSNLKTYSDAKGDFHSLHKLVFNDIRDPAIRTDILNHIRREAGVQTAHMRLGTKRAMKRRQQAWRKVLSDVDDTLYSSGGRYPAGLDTRYPRHTLYPGVLSFYRELDMGATGPDDWTDDRVGNLVFLSARPHVYKDVSEKKSYAKFAALYENKGMHTLPTMLAGNLKSGRAFMVQGDLEPMAQKKYENFCEFYQLYPEFTHVFVGDNGQGDVRAAELIHEKFGSSALEAGFFQLIQPIEKTFGYHSKEDIEKWRSMNIVFFNTYAGAAVEAYKMGMIRLLGLRKICVDAIKNFEEIVSWTSPQSRENARNLLNGDLERANALLTPTFEPLSLVMRPQVFPFNSDVRTPFGKAIVRKFRGTDGIYQVDLIDWSNVKRKRRVQAFFPEESLMANVPGDVTQIAKSSVKYVRFRRAPLARVFAPQTPVSTPFGDGRVVRFRPEDEIYEVSIDGGVNMMSMTGYFAPDAIYEIKRLDTDTSSPRMFAGVRSSLGYITKRLSTFVPGTGAKPFFNVGATVETPFGRGVVLRMRLSDRAYEIQLLEDGFSKTRTFVQERSLKLAPVSPSRSFLSRLGLSSNSGKFSTTGSILKGSYVVTPYGKGVMQRYRVEDDLYEVVLTDWTLTGGQNVIAYVTKPFLRHVEPAAEDMPTLSLSKSSSQTQSGPPSSGGIFQLLRYGFASSSSNDLVPYANDGVSRRLDTPFGIGYTNMAKPYNGALMLTMDDPCLYGVVAFIQDSAVTELEPLPHKRRNTLDLLGYPFSYLRGGWNSRTPSESSFVVDSMHQAGPVFVVGSLVATPFGDGTVVNYRPEDHVFVVEIGSLNGYFQVSALKHPVRGGVGTPVSTTFGSGILEGVRSGDGVHVVALRHALMDTMEIRGYLQPRHVLGEIKAARGDVVQTPYGTGVVVSYRVEDDFYCIALDWDHTGNTHVSAYVRGADVIRSGSVEKSSSGCVVM